MTTIVAATAATSEPALEASGSSCQSHGARVRAALRDERGAETAEYAIATMAAVAFAGLLVAIMQSDTVRAMLEDLVARALTFAG
ncbi:hypothetical protein GCM10011490_20890 [Pseudoclavibacter endophyticus]|uniref:DUF4244 domain-containing protein n=1 Tax=Pseudoclavibacter endophyticus TaxID=1778590 RepID=A0A6H9WBU7_9MICO|nr:DUF4244 domain-containing protein [Pseudoclavibacter endophyticus]KAB1648143.1 DUF4244 domain-containing protein [Pseudoclavibacter endophyticus]GGA70080.1 hypothetical protein GCM10011490_20890 [Pseudoclavibacter endophyticus]